MLPETLLGWLKTPPEVMATAAAFTKIRAPTAMPAAYLTTAAYAILVARKDTTSPLACVCLAATVNVALDYLAVAYLGMGAAGAAWATTVALWVGCVAILNVVRRRGFTADFPWGTLRYREQMAPVMAFAGPITFLVFALLSIYTALILFANSLGVTVSAAHRIAGNVFAVAVLCGDPPIQAGQAFMPGTVAARAPAGGGAEDGRPAAAGGLRRRRVRGNRVRGDLRVRRRRVHQGHAGDRAGARRWSSRWSPPSSPTWFRNPCTASPSRRNSSAAGGITGVGLVLFALALWRMNAVLAGPALYYWMWWVVAGYYALAIVCIQVLTFGGPGGSGRGIVPDDAAAGTGKRGASGAKEGRGRSRPPRELDHRSCGALYHSNRVVTIGLSGERRCLSLAKMAFVSRGNAVINS